MVRTDRPKPLIHFLRKCVECERVFNLLKEIDEQEWHYGHDCEV